MPPPFHLRPAEKTDAASIRRLIWKVGINPSSLRWQRFILAVDENGNMIGCGQVKPHAGGTLELASLAVEPDWRSRGVAQAIIDHLIAAHPGTLYLTCRAPLASFYQRFGFRTLSEPEFPPYFRRIRRFVNLFGAVVMQRDGP